MKKLVVPSTETAKHLARQFKMMALQDNSQLLDRADAILTFVQRNRVPLELKNSKHLQADSTPLAHMLAHASSSTDSPKSVRQALEMILELHGKNIALEICTAIGAYEERPTTGRIIAEYLARQAEKKEYGEREIGRLAKALQNPHFVEAACLFVDFPMIHGTLLEIVHDITMQRDRATYDRFCKELYGYAKIFGGKSQPYAQEEIRKIARNVTGMIF